MKSLQTTVALVASLVFVQAAHAFKEPAQERLPNFDKRQAAPQKQLPAEKKAGVEKLKAQVAKARVDFDAIVGAPKLISAHDGFLSGPDGKGRGISPKPAASIPANDPHRVTKSFLKEHRELFGHGPEALDDAKMKRQFVTPHNGMKTTVWQQELDGILVFEGVLISHVTKRDELVSIASGFIGDPLQAANNGIANRGQILATPPIDARDAVARAAKNTGDNIKPETISSLRAVPEGAEKRQTFRAGGLKGDVEAQLIWLPVTDNEMRLCWEILFTSGARDEMFRTLVDAQTGDVWVRHGLTEYFSDATFRVYTSDSPSPFSPGHPAPLTNQPALISRSLIVTNALSTNASPNGWIDDGANQTLGNNVDAHLDKVSDNVPDPGSRPQGSPFRAFDFTMDLTQAPATYTNAAVVQLFYWCNWMHDKLYALGFTEAAGNFQSNNFGRGGLGNDPLQADAQDGGGSNNANMSTPTDGTSPRMQMYIFTGPTPDRDGDFDAEVILHEYTHGLSNRRVGGGVGLSALQSRGMGEGWSDFYGLSLLSEASDNINGNYAAGGYLTYELSAGFYYNYYYGIRRYPYSTDLSKNPLTFKDIDPSQASAHTGIPRSSVIGNTADEVHNQGEVWCVTLWEVRAALITKYGYTVGNQLALQLVTDGMNLSPANPNFLQARNGIIQADLVNNGGANRNELWAAFAKRGMGFSATSPSSSATTGLRESFDIPDDLSITPSGSITAAGPVGGPFDISSTTFVLTNVGSNSISWTATNSSTWLAISASSGTIPVGGNRSVTASLTSAANALSQGIYTDTLRFTNLTTGVGQSRQFTLRVGQPDFFTELFDSGDLDLSNSTITFTPNGSGDFYYACREATSSLPTDPLAGQKLTLLNHSTQALTLTNGAQISIYGVSASTFYLSSDGHITFNTPDSTGASTLANHFAMRRVSALFGHLHPSDLGGAVYWQQSTNRAVITFQNVPEYTTSATNTFQMELFFDGRIRLSWLRVSMPTCLVGLSAGSGQPNGFQESDLSSYRACALPLDIVLPAVTTEGDANPGLGAVSTRALVSSNLTINLSSSDTNEVIVPPSVIIPAGQSNVTFNLTVIDDAVLDGTQRPTITASAPGYFDAVTSIAVNDNETAILQVTAPAQAVEGNTPISGIVTASAPVAKNTMVTLTSSDTTEIVVPLSVTISAGQTSAVFGITIADDLEIDNAQTASITASVTNWTSGSGSVTVLDNEATNLTVTLPSSAMEGDGVRTDAGRVAISGTLLTNLTVSLLSSDITELTVPASITIPAGQTFARFDLTVVDDADIDGQQTVAVQADAPDFINGSNTMVIYDDESPAVPATPNPAHLATNVIASTDLSWSSGEATPRTNIYDVYFGTNPTPGRTELLGSTTNTSWSLPTLAPATTYYWQIVSRRIGQTAGPVWQFTTRGVDHFEWTTIGSSQYVGTPFAATITAKDEFNSIVSNFNSTVTLSALSGSIPAPLFSDNFEDGDFNGWINNGGSFTRAVTNDTAAGGNYSFTLIGGSSTHFTGISHSLSNSQPSTINYYVRTSNTNAASGYFVIGYTTATTDTAAFLYVKTNYLTVAMSSTPTFSVPLQPNQWNRISLLMNWTNHTYQLYVNNALAQANVPFRGSNVPYLTAVYLYNFDSGQAWWDEIEFLGGASPKSLALSPTNSGTFTDGTWTGNFTIQEPATNAFLKADDGRGHVGNSASFNVLLRDDLSLSMTNSPNPAIIGKNFTCSITVANTGPADSTGVVVTNSLPASGNVVSISSSQGTYVHSVGQQIVFNLGTIAGSSNAVMTITMNVSNPGSVTNRASVGRLEPEIYLANNNASTVETVVQPAISVSDVAVTEQSGGTTTNALVNVSLSGAAGFPVQVNFATANNTAVASSDYISTNGTLVFNPGETNKTISISIAGDSLNEGTETFYFLLSNPTNATLSRSQATVTILDDDPLPYVYIDDQSIIEGNAGTNSTMSFTVRLSAPSGRTTSVVYGTSSGTASSGSDFIGTQGTLTFNAGETNKSIVVTITGDNFVEANEYFYVTLSSAVNLNYGDSQALGNILDDDNILANGDSLVWNTIASPQQTNTPFPATITARDFANAVKANFSGQVALSAFNFDPSGTNRILGNTTHSASGNFGSFTVGYSFTPTTNLLVTHVRHYAGSKVSIWTDNGTLLTSQNVSSAPGAWTETALASPVQLNAGARYRIAAFTGGTTYYWQTNGPATFADGTIEQGFDSIGDAFPTNTNSVRWFMVDLRYMTGLTTPLTVSPSTVVFTNGAWSGNLSIPQAASNAFVRAQNNSVTGLSGFFTVRTDCPVPVAPISPAPANNSTNIVWTPTLSWRDGGQNSTNCPVTYDVYFGKTAPFLDLVASGISQTNFAPGNLDLDTVYYWQVVANRVGSQANGPLWSFRTKPMPTIHHFAWSSIPAAQSVGVPFNVTITALDAFNVVVTNFNSSVALSGSAANGVTTNFILGNLTSSSSSSGTYTLGYSFIPSTNLVVTHLRSYMGTKASIWTDTGNLLVSLPNSGPTGTWTETALPNPVSLSAGVRYRIGCYVPGTTYYYQSPGPTNFAHGAIDQGWFSTNDSFPATTTTARGWFVDAKYNVGSSGSINITPTNTGLFSSGVWTGSITVQQASSNVVLRADDGNGHSGNSSPFNVFLANDLSVSITDAPDPVSLGGNLTNTIVLNNSGPALATGVVVTNFMAAGANLVSVSTPQGSYSVGGGMVIFSLGNVSSGANLVLQVVSSPTLAGTATNSVVISRNEIDGSAANNSAITTTLVVDYSAGIFDDFEPNIDMSQWWLLTGSVVATNSGGYVSPSHSLWFGGTGERSATTRPLNTTAGGSITFYLRIADGLSEPWERADLPGEGIVLESTTNNGNTWTTLGTYDTYAYTNWTNIQLSMPVAAQSPATQFRWRQMANSGSCCDHWAIDDVQITGTASVAPTIQSHPQSKVVEAGTNVAFTVVATGSSPLLYQWRFNGAAINGATASALSLTSVTLSQSGLYSVVVSNVVGSVTSSNATLTVVNPGPIIAINILDAGWYDATGYHSPSNPNYIVGDLTSSSATPPFRNWFAFNIPSFTGPIFSAELRVSTYGISSPTGAETYQLRHVSTPVSTLIAGGSGLTSIYVDLGDGSIYAARNFTPAEANQIITIPLNDPFIADITAAKGSAFAIGGEITTLDGTRNEENIFSASIGSASDVQLILYLEPRTDHFAWTTIPSTQEVNEPIFVTITAKDANNQTVTNFNGSVNFSGSATVSRTNSSAFTNGVWSGTITITSASSNVVLRAEDSSGHFGLSNPFSVASSLPRTIATSTSGTNLVLSWPMGFSYVLEVTDTLSPPNWTPLTNGIVVANGRMICTNGTTNVQRFYRLRKN